MGTVTFRRAATLDWEGDVMHGKGKVQAASEAFEVGATFPSVRGDPPGATTPEELMAASHAVCFGIGVRSVIARNGGSALRVRATATISAEKGPQGIRIRSSHLQAVVVGLAGIGADRLAEIGTLVERDCTISTAIRGAVAITHEIVSD